MSETLIDTGLIGLSVNPPEAEPPAQSLVVVTPQATVEMPTGWTIHRASAFMRELACEFYEIPTILAKHGVTIAQFDQMQANETFKQTLSAMRAEWNSASNTPKRLALESLILLEDALPTVAARLSKNTEPLPGVVELAKLLAKLGGLGEGTQNAAPTERFKITINLGADVMSVDKTRTIQQVGQGASVLPTVQLLTERS